MNGEEKIRAYLDRAFSGVKQTKKVQDTKEALYADLLEKYKGLLAQGYMPESAYQTVISGIGDIFELVDSAAEECETDKSFHTNSGIFSKFSDMVPFLMVIVLLILWAGRMFFPLAPHNRNTLPVLLLGAALGACILWALLKYRDGSLKMQLFKENVVLIVVWGIAILLFLWAMTIPRLEQILWLIPIVALAIHQIIVNWITYKHVKERDDFHE